jgi:hypothetical protein
MELKKISLSAKLAGKALIGFDTSAWGRDAEAAPGAFETQNGKSRLGAKIGGKPGDKLGAKVGTKLGSKIVEVRARVGLKN